MRHALTSIKYRITKRTATQSPPRHHRRRRRPELPHSKADAFSRPRGAHPSALETLAARATMAATAVAPGAASSLLLSPRRSRAAAPRFRSPVSLPSRWWSGCDRV